MLPFVKLPLLRLFYGFKQYRWNYHLDDWRSNIDVVMNELKQSGFVNRDVSSTMIRISNYAYLHTGAVTLVMLLNKLKVYTKTL